MIVIFTGYTASGKTTYENLFLETYPEYKKLVTITTRPKRKKETDGVDYHFVTEELFNIMKQNNEIISPRSYNTIQDGKESVWYYGIRREDFGKDLIYTTILDPGGVLDVINHVGKKNIKIVHLVCHQEELFRRAAFRGDEAQEFIRRLASDKEEFKKIQNLVNLTLQTNVDEVEQAKNIQKIKKLLED